MVKLRPEVITNPPPMRPGYTIASVFLAVALLLTSAVMFALDARDVTAAHAVAP